MRSRLSDSPTLEPVGRMLVLLIVVAWFFIAWQLVTYVLGSGLDATEDDATRLHHTHVALVWAGVLVGTAVAGIASGVAWDNAAAVILFGCLAVVSLMALLIVAPNDNRSRQEQSPESPATPTRSHCAVYSGGTNDCPGG